MTNQSDRTRSSVLRTLAPAGVLWGPVAAYMAGIFVVSSISVVPSLPGGMSDKLAHALLYAGLGALAVRALARGRWAGVGSLALAGSILLATLYGVTDEIHQRFVPGRQCDVVDLAADAGGAAAAAAALWAWSIIRRFFGPQSGRA